LAARKADEKAREAAAVREKMRTASETSRAAAERVLSEVRASERAEKEARLLTHKATLQSLRCTEFEEAAREAKAAAEAAERSGHGLESARRSLAEAERDEEEGRRVVSAAEKEAEEALRVAMEAMEAKRRAQAAAAEAELSRKKECVLSEELDASVARCVAETSVRVEELRVADAALSAAVMAGPRIGAEVLSHVSTARGIRDEEAGIAAVPGFVAGDGALRCRYFSVGSVTFKFGGRIDGRHAESGKMLEVKNRQNRLFHFIPTYERIQILVYLYIFQEDACTLRQRHAGQVVDEDVRWNEDEFRRLLEPGLASFSDKLEKMQTDDAFRLEVLREHSAR
jgi:hypothetical protein